MSFRPRVYITPGPEKMGSVPSVKPGMTANVTITTGKAPAITADILGLADLELLEKRIPAPPSAAETFDPEAIHRQKIREILVDFSAADQEIFVSFLKRTTLHVSGRESAVQQGNHTKAIILISAD